MWRLAVMGVIIPLLLGLTAARTGLRPPDRLTSLVAVALLYAVGAASAPGVREGAGRALGVSIGIAAASMALSLAGGVLVWAVLSRR